MSTKKFLNSLEPLESRIAPASVSTAAPLYPTVAQAEAMPNGTGFVSAVIGTPIVVHAGQVLTTGNGPESGTYLLFVQQGEAIVFITDLNNNGAVDPNEITGIAASDHLRLISFVDIHGDVVTDLNANGTLSDSKSNAGLANSSLKGDGRILLNNSVDLLEFRSLTQTDLTAGEDLTQRIAPTNYSLYGNVYAGRSFGATDGGLLIDTTGAGMVHSLFGGGNGVDFFPSGIIHPAIGSIFTGTATSGHFFSFGVSRGDDQHPSGTLAQFTPAAGQAGGDILNVTANGGTAYNIASLVAGDGGVGARGGNIAGVVLNGDTSGYNIIAGNGGAGPTGGTGGSVVHFSDLSAFTGQVLLQSGSGGLGTTGSGGDAGTVTLGTMNTQSGLTIQLGNGGDGFTSGGNGSSFPSGLLTAPISTVGVRATSVISTTHAVGQEGVIGTTIPIDFNGDGAGDIVFATKNPDQLVVAFGDGTGYLQLTNAPLVINGKTVPGQAPIYLPVPYGTIDSVTVGDFLGNGHQDIAVVSGDSTQNAGVSVYISKYNANGQFVGFDSPRETPLPTLFANDPAAPIPLYRYLRANTPVTGIVAGDFSGSGHTELAISATYYSKITNTPNQLVMFLKPDLVDGAPDGQFYADVGQKAIAVPATGPNPLVPFTRVSLGGTNTYLEATALSTGANHDVVVAVPVDGLGAGKKIDILDNSQPTAAGPAFNVIGTGKVDTNRDLGADKINLVDAVAGHFSVLDFNGDGAADFAVLTQSPKGFMVGIKGNGLGGGSITSGGGDNAGTYFGDKGFGIGTAQVDVRTVNLGGAALDTVGVLDYDQKPGFPLYFVVEAKLVDNSNANQDPDPNVPKIQNPGAARLGSFFSQIFPPPPVTTFDGSVVAFDVYTPLLSAPKSKLFATGVPDTTPADAVHQALSIEIIPPPGLIIPDVISEVNNFIHINAGNGGSGLVGAGGKGGFIGGGLNLATFTGTSGGGTGSTSTFTQIVGALDIVLPPDQTFAGDVVLSAGFGGNGFTNGGTGGGISGTTVYYAATPPTGVTFGPGVPPLTTANAGNNNILDPVSLIGGNGGMGISGAGGAGGDLTKNSIDQGVFFQAGNGGTGALGGRGGFVLGNGFAGIFDTLDVTVQVNGGIGANGVKLGGTGGGVLNFRPLFATQIVGGVGGDYGVVGGNGGTAISGPGGAGGSVINDTPLQGAGLPNYMAGDILLQGGDGGNGLAGGKGGAVVNFNDAPTLDNPAILAILGGAGGKGITGPGGSGGSISQVITASLGQARPRVLPLTAYQYDRVVAGDGGSSAGGVGGAGGTILNVSASTEFDAFAMAAGAGGIGLTDGGSGGSIINDYVQFGGQSASKTLVVAGAGGGATAFLSNLFDNTTPGQADKAFGGVIGRGGHGGNINGFHQTGGIQVRTDLIAGDGGDTLNYGSKSDVTSFTGIGGSIVNSSVEGTIGNMDPTVPLKSYNDIVHGETMAHFVQNRLRNEPLAAFDPNLVAIDDGVGSVGIEVGGAGRLKSEFAGYDNNNQPIYASLPASQGVNGSLLGLSSRGIESAVAGNIERIGAITAVRDITLTANGTIGVDKLGPANYLDSQGNPIPQPVIGGVLIDGALIAGSQPTRLDPNNGLEEPVTLPGNHIFVLS